MRILAYLHKEILFAMICKVQIEIMYYLILLGSISIFLGTILLVHFLFPQKQHLIIERIIPFVLIAVVAVRFMCFNDVQFRSENYGTFMHLGGPLHPFFNLLGNICYWLEGTALLLVLCRPWAGFKTAKFYVKFIALPILTLSAIALCPTLMMMQGHDNWSLLTILMPIEIGGLLALSLYYLSIDWDVKISKHSYAEVAVFSTLINFATMPCFMPNFFFGMGPIGRFPIDLSIYHRLFLYTYCIIAPLGIYFGLRNAHQDKIRYTLIIISLGTLMSYMVEHKWNTILTPWDWPMHLCNLAMLLIPLCLIFKLKRLFYFTYFINVFGATMAMMMPDYESYYLIFNPHVIYFWMNHCCAFMMPLLGVALYEFDRPKLKQFFYSIIGFLGYFVAVLAFNTIFTGLELQEVEFLSKLYRYPVVIHRTNFFFLNSTFIADKAGQWAVKLFHNSAITFTIKDRTMTIYLAYQLMIFFVYILIGFVMWFVYQLFFDIADAHKALHYKLRGIRIDRLALKSALNGRSLDKPMKKNAGISLELKNFSKKYGLNKFYSAHNVNLKVKKGEVFGFLGPNGAGKSTCIKSIVGIQTITEGSISVCGFDVKTQPVSAKSLIGFVPDHYALYENLTGREYLNYIADIYEVPKDLRDERIQKYVTRFELEGSIDSKIKTYSHGMKQKVTIISALVHDPKVWILDEPLTGLDPTSIYQVKECMKEHAAEGNIVFFSSHLIDIVEKLCNRIAIIKGGEIQCIKTLEEIEQDGQTLEQFYLSVIQDTTTKIEK